MTTPATARPAAARAVAVLAAVLGLAVSVYLTVEHFDSSVQLACPETGTINCAKVTTSRWSAIAGVPVAVLGLAFFLALLAVLLAPSRLRLAAPARLGVATVGLLTVFWLVYVELFLVDAICLWCTAVHVLTLVAFVAVLWETSSHWTATKAG